MIRGILVSSEELRKGYGKVVIYNTGLLPAQFRATQGQFKDFINPTGHTVITGKYQRDGQVHIAQFASFHWWGWLVVWAIVFSPLVSYYYRYLRLKRLGLWRAPLLDTSTDPYSQN